MIFNLVSTDFNAAIESDISNEWIQVTVTVEYNTESTIKIFIDGQYKETSTSPG